MALQSATIKTDGDKVNNHQTNLVALPDPGFACPTSSVIFIRQSYW
jgi:hypothetical protein